VNHYVSFLLTNRKYSVLLHALYSPRTALRTFTPRRDQLVICGHYPQVPAISFVKLKSLMCHRVVIPISDLLVWHNVLKTCVGVIRITLLHSLLQVIMCKLQLNDVSVSDRVPNVVFDRLTLCFVLGRPRVQISAPRPTILTEGSVNFSVPSGECHNNSYLTIRQQPLLSKYFLSVIRLSLFHSTLYSFNYWKVSLIK
jgi:hypothetical protein